jgi:hypothetical protein
MLAKVMAKRIEHRKLSEVTLYPRNPRRDSDAQISQIAGSILAFGFNSPILVDAKGGIIAGHGRYLAALKLGLETVPTVVLDHLSETEKRAYLLADNKLADLASFNNDLLREELAELRFLRSTWKYGASTTTSCGCCFAEAQPNGPWSNHQEHQHRRRFKTLKYNCSLMRLLVRR